MEKINVGVLGATGSVGQRFVQLLTGHPWFNLTVVAASNRSAGKPYREACNWFLSDDMPSNVAEMIVQPIEPNLDCQLVFSALPADLAGPVEASFAAAGYGVLTNARSHRYDDDVPLVTAEVNPDHLDILPYQQAKRGWSKGFIVANSNCCAMPLALTLKPLHDAFQVKKLIVQTMQALSGAGYNGVPSLAALDNVIPFIKGEEEKLGVESQKMLGSYASNVITSAEFALSAHCNRVSTLDGHLETVSVTFEDPGATVEAIEACWRDWNPLPQQLKLPSAPTPPLIVRSEPNRPQTRLDRDNGKGMAVTIGRLRPCEVLGFKYVHLSHNTIRGAAGASVLNAELMKAQGMLDQLL
ncbi:MAG: aspartate-semialdehyde dehydrogenase [Chloroflexota bacterium]